MTAQFKEKFDSWLGLQDNFSGRLKEFRDLADTYIGTADAPPENLKEKLEGLEGKVNGLKKDFIEMLGEYFELYGIAQSLIVRDKKAAAVGEVEDAGKDLAAVGAQTLDVPVSAAAEAAAAEDRALGVIPDSDRPSKGILGYMNYVDWFYSKNPDEQKKIAAIFLSDPRFKEKDLLETNITFLPPKMTSYMYQTANKLMAEGFDDMGVALLIKGLTIVTDKVDKEMIHIIYAKYFYRKRKELKDAYLGCISHCEKAVKSFMSDNEPRNKPIAPFKLLTKIYEEEEKYDKILDIAQKAIKLYEKSPTPERAEGFKKIVGALQQRGIG